MDMSLPLAVKMVIQFITMTTSTAFTVLPAPPAKKEYKASGVRAPALWWSVAISMPKEDVTMDST